MAIRTVSSYASLCLFIGTPPASRHLHRVFLWALLFSTGIPSSLATPFTMLHFPPLLRLLFLYLGISSSAASVGTQSSPGSCAENCVVQVLTSALDLSCLFPITDISCICMDSQLLESVYGCVTQQCSTSGDASAVLDTLCPAQSSSSGRSTSTGASPTFIESAHMSDPSGGPTSTIDSEPTRGSSVVTIISSSVTSTSVGGTSATATALSTAGTAHTASSLLQSSTESTVLASMLTDGRSISTGLSGSIYTLSLSTATHTGSSGRSPDTRNSTQAAGKHASSSHPSTVATPVSLSLVLLLVLCVGALLWSRLRRKSKHALQLQTSEHLPLHHRDGNSDIIDIARALPSSASTSSTRVELGEATAWLGVASDVIHIRLPLSPEDDGLATPPSIRSSVSTSGTFNRYSLPSPRENRWAFRTELIRSEEASFQPSIQNGCSLPTVQTDNPRTPHLLPRSTSIPNTQADTTSIGLSADADNMRFTSPAVYGGTLSLRPASLGATVQIQPYPEALNPSPSLHDSSSAEEEPRIVVNLPFSIGHRLLEMSGASSLSQAVHAQSPEYIREFDAPPPYY
ncbi:hypothetical protein GY45DRAFT_134220 [Cubamyces sp. BRFM 1775]|nr:hypothetical protein GY45DRAFT_134220 [Cubamyces sp. BRFM 1775]